MIKYCTECVHIRKILSEFSPFYNNRITGEIARYDGLYCSKYSRWETPERDIVGVRHKPSFVVTSPYKARDSEDQCGKDGRDFKRRTSFIGKVINVIIRHNHNTTLDESHE